jgi:hypothetical protein
VSSTNSGHAATLSGVVMGQGTPSQVQLWASPYPFHKGFPVRVTTTDAGGNFSFKVFPDRDSLFAVVLVGGSAKVPLAYVGVKGQTVTKVTALPLGRAKVVVVVLHPRDLRWTGEHVSWSFAEGWHGRFSAVPSTRTKRLSPYATVLYTSVTLPAGHFRWRACFTAPLYKSLENPRRPPGCHGRGYYGGGSLPVGYPNPGAVGNAERFLAGRAGRDSVAVVDSEGRESGANLDEQFPAASVVKSMLLVGYLRRLDAMGQHFVDSYSNSFLYPMINVSDNNAATTCWSIVGNGGLYDVAHAAGMRDFSVTTDWGSAMISAGDMARFFFEMDSLIPREFVGYARNLLSTIAGYESWGVPAIARPQGYQVFFKGGWRPNEGEINQVARLERHGRTFTIAVLTVGPPGMSYGIDSIQGATAALLR